MMTFIPTFILTSYYANQKKTLEVNPRHPLIKKLLDLVEKDASDQSAKDLSRLMFETANMRSGYQLKVLLDECHLLSIESLEHGSLSRL